MADDDHQPEPDYILDITGLDGRREDPASASDHSQSHASVRPWVGVQFDCCGVYARVYRNPEATEYIGYCPRCRRKVQLRVGPDGTHARLFRAK